MCFTMHLTGAFICMQMAAATEREQVTTKAAILDHNMVHVRDFAFNEVVPATDSTKFFFNLIIDSLVPFMGSYVQVCGVHARLYA